MDLVYVLPQPGRQLPIYRSDHPLLSHKWCGRAGTVFGTAHEDVTAFALFVLLGFTVPFLWLEFHQGNTKLGGHFHLAT